MSWKITTSNLLVDDADALAYLTAVEAADTAAGQSGGLESGVRLAVNAFVKGCKADGIWPAIKASCILAGARTLQGALVPLVGAAPTNFNFVSGDYNRETGLVGDGSTKYISSGRANNADPRNSKHLSIYVSSIGNAATQYLIAAGTYGTAGNSSVFRDAGTYRGRVNVAATSPTSVINSGVLPSPAFVGVSRTAADSQSIRASTSTVSNSLGSVTPSSEVVNIYAGPSTDRLFSNSRLAFYSIGESLDLALLDARVTTLINAIAAAIP